MTGSITDLLSWAVQSLKGHLARSRDIFGFHYWGWEGGSIGVLQVAARGCCYTINNAHDRPPSQRII